MTTPEPIITSLETLDWPVDWYPVGPRSLAQHARKCQWNVRTGFSRGYVPGQAGGSWDLRDMIGVWVDGYGRRAGAFWERNPDAEFSARKLEAGVKPGEIPSGMQWSTTGTIIRFGHGASFPYASLTDIRYWLSVQGNVPPEWYDSIKDAVLEKRDAAAKSAKARPVKKKEREHS